jgi:hypothetical protein
MVAAYEYPACTRVFSAAERQEFMPKSAKFYAIVGEKYVHSGAFTDNPDDPRDVFVKTRYAAIVEQLTYIFDGIRKDHLAETKTLLSGSDLMERRRRGEIKQLSFPLSDFPEGNPGFPPSEEEPTCAYSLVSRESLKSFYDIYSRVPCHYPKERAVVTAVAYNCLREYYHPEYLLLTEIEKEGKKHEGLSEVADEFSPSDFMNGKTLQNLCDMAVGRMILKSAQKVDKLWESSFDHIQKISSDLAQEWVEAGKIRNDQIQETIVSLMLASFSFVKSGCIVTGRSPHEKK